LISEPTTVRVQSQTADFDVRLGLKKTLPAKAGVTQNPANELNILLLQL